LRGLLGLYTGLYQDYSWVGRRILRLDLRPYMSLSGYDGPVSIAVDSSGVRVCRCGGWVERVYGRRNEVYQDTLRSRHQD
jgi:hypothetical protein